MGVAQRWDPRTKCLQNNVEVAAPVLVDVGPGVDKVIAEDLERAGVAVEPGKRPHFGHDNVERAPISPKHRASVAQTTRCGTLAAVLAEASEEPRVRMMSNSLYIHTPFGLPVPCLPCGGRRWAKHI